MAKDSDQPRFFKTPAGNVIATTQLCNTTVSLLLKDGSWVAVPFGISVEAAWERWKLPADAIAGLPPLPVRDPLA